MPLIFGLPFLEMNDILCDHKNQACIICDKNLNYNLLKPQQRQPPLPPKLWLWEQINLNKRYKKETLWELLHIFPSKWKECLLPDIDRPQPNYITLIMHHIKTLKIEASMEKLEMNLQKSFSKVFEPIPHVDELPLQPLTHITPKDVEKTIKTRNYPCPQK